MHIRKRKIKSGDIQAHHKETIDQITSILQQIERTDKFRNTIGAEIQVTRKMVTYEISAFSNVHLSTFVTELLIKLRNKNLPIRHSTKSMERFYTPVYTHIIEID